jgi:hypothetical protein
MLNFVYSRSSRLKVLHFLAWFMHCQQGGEVWAYFVLLDAVRRFSGGFEPFLGSVAHRSDRSQSPVWPVRVLALFTWWAPVLPVVMTGLTGQSWADTAALFSSSGLHAFVQGELHWFRGSLHVCRGVLCGFRALVGDLCSFLQHGFVSNVSSRCPCLNGLRLVLFRWSFSLPLFDFWSLVGVSFYSFLFFSLMLLFVDVVNALIKGEIEDNVWFEYRWMVASWCDEWLTTLCGLILG